MVKRIKIYPVLFTSIVLSLSILILSSCSDLGYGSNSSSPSVSASRKKGPLPELYVNGDVLNLPLDSLTTLDPQLAVYTNSFELIGCMIDGLMQPAPDGSVTYAICKDYSVSADGLFYTFNLRDDVYWNNGEPVTAHDFVFAWQRAIDPATASEYAFMISDIAHIKNGVAIQAGLMDKNQLGVKAVDDYTFTVELTVPVPYFTQLLYFATFYPANQKFVESVGEAYGTSCDTIMGNGAFVMTEWTPDKTIKFVKNTAYYDADKVKLAGLNFTHYDTRADAFAAFKAGKLDYLQIYTDTVKEMKDKPEFRTVDSGFLHYISCNLTNPLLENKNLRKALTFAFDRNEFTDKVLGDGSKGAYVPVPSGYTFNSKGQDFSKEGVERPEYCDYNPTLARQYFEKAKAELGRNNMILELLIVDSTTQNAMADSFKTQVEKNLPGVTINIRKMEKSAERRKAMSKGEFELGFTNWGPDYSDPMTYLSMWQVGNTQNNEKYFNPHYEAILARCSDGDLCTKPDERWTALKQAEEMVMDDSIILPVYQQCNAVVIQQNVKDLEFHAIALARVYKRAYKK